jgi:hypothetical protein
MGVRNQLAADSRMNVDQSKDQDNTTHLISSIFRSAFIRVNPRLDQVLARALHAEASGILSDSR